jgi:hypothetical protein
MTLRTPITLLLLPLLVVQSSAFAASAPLELKWNELAPLIAGHTVEVTLPAGATLKGEVASVREDALVLDVKKTSDSKAYPKGNAVIPRASVTLLKLEKGGGSGWRTMGTVVGVLSGVVLGGYIAAKTANDAGPAVAIFLVTASAISIAGYAIGRSAGKKTTLIRIVP